MGKKDQRRGVLEEFTSKFSSNAFGKSCVRSGNMLPIFFLGFLFVFYFWSFYFHFIIFFLYRCSLYIFFYYLSCHWCLYFFLFVFLFCFLSYRWKGCVGQLILFYFYFKGEQLANGFFFFRSIATHHPVHRLIRWRRVKASRLTSLRLRFENWTK